MESIKPTKVDLEGLPLEDCGWGMQRKEVFSSPFFAVPCSQTRRVKTLEEPPSLKEELRESFRVREGLT